MKKKNSFEAIGRFFKLLYLKFYRSNDTPQRLALGFGLGVFLGIMPGLGIIAAVVLAGLLRVNRVTALLGTLTTNTWLSFATLVFSTKVGSSIMGLNWQQVYSEWKNIIKTFSLLRLFKTSFNGVLVPMALGFITVSFCVGLIAYIVSLFVIIEIKRIKNLRIIKKAKRLPR